MCSVKGFVDHIVLSVISGSNWRSCKISSMNKGGYYTTFYLFLHELKDI